MPSIPDTPGVTVGLPGPSGAGRISPAAAGAVGQVIAQTTQGLANDAIRFEEAEHKRAMVEQDRQDSLAAARIVAEANRDWTERLLTAKNDPATDPNGFTPRFLGDFRADIDARLSDATDGVRERVEARFIGLESKIFEQAITFEAAAVKAKKADDLDATLRGHANAVRLDDTGYAEAVGEAVNAIDQLGLGADETRDRKRAAREDLARAAVQGLIERDPELARERLRGGAFNQDLPEGDLNGFLSAADKAIEARQKDAQAVRDAAAKEAETAEKERIAERVAALDLAISRGEAGYEEIQQGRSEGWLSPAKTTEFAKRVDKRFRDQDDATASIALGAAAYSGETILDPKNKEHRDAVDLHFRGMFPQWAELPPSERATRIADYVNRTGIIPEPLRAHIRGSLRAGDPETKAAAADMIDRIAASNPAALDDFAKEDVAAGVMTAQFVRMGVDAKQAVNLAQTAVYDAKSPEREERGRELREDAGALGEDAVDHVVDQIDDTGIFSEADAGSRLRGEAARLYEAFYLQTGDDEAARTLTLRTIKSQWGITAIGGERLMKFAPEVVYANGADAEWMAEQLHSELAPLLPTMDDREERIRLEADNRTLRELASGPSYQVWTQDEDGVWNPLVGDDGPIRWRPEWETSEEKRRHDERNRRDLNNARESRELIPLADELSRTRGPVVPKVGVGHGGGNAAAR